MTALTGPDRAMVRYLARQVDWFVLHAFHHHGIGAASDAIGFAGGTGHDDDGVFRRWETQTGGRWLIYREGSFDAPPRRIALREVLAWARQQLTAAQWGQIDDLVWERDAAIEDGMPRDFWRSRENRSDEENTRIDAGRRRQGVAERELRRIVGEALAEREPVGEQLDLFTDL